MNTRRGGKGRRVTLDPDRKLAIARAQLKVYRQAVRVPAGVEVPGILRDPGAPARFVHAWTVQRGYTGITQALDEDGQVWERVIIIENIAGRKTAKDSWWEPIPMTRKEAGASMREAAEVMGAS